MGGDARRSIPEDAPLRLESQKRKAATNGLSSKSGPATIVTAPAHERPCPPTRDRSIAKRSPHRVVGGRYLTWSRLYGEVGFSGWVVGSRPSHELAFLPGYVQAAAGPDRSASRESRANVITGSREPFSRSHASAVRPVVLVG